MCSWKAVRLKICSAKCINQCPVFYKLPSFLGCKSGNQTYQLYGDQLNMDELKVFIVKMLIRLELNPPKAES
ncbi:hypothetical protein P879_07017 [Paragonimus westermani]|uniref:Uncharacterized protein n=1 Tax=Paragonimus westermani TaxID=34504 RepID=A0A8T0DFV9_9TREM|nr:hypothetical protein P879_07017 [Paragonimus westermani]